MPMAVVHLILNAHVDPVWLWPWQAGVDEIIATCRSACDRLDTHSDLIFTRGEAWSYSVVEDVDPPLFRRIVRHVNDGRWEIVGGWWIQPDCNLPTRVGMERQIALGRDYFLSRFGRFPRVGYNVDSFGHSGFLPELMNRFGQDRYVMMRPQEHELPLPTRLFRWRGADGGSEVTAFRIAGNYETNEITRAHVERSLTELPPGAGHTMCFVGLGDHGGGPTERQIAWCREHATAFEGHKLTFSSPSRFFDAIEAQALGLPVVEGELQQHAPGCYSVERRVKTAVRRAESALVQAEIALAADLRPPIDAQARLGAAWRQVCFNHFHDTLGGTSIPSAYDQVYDQLGGAAATADEVAHMALRRTVAGLPPDPRQRMVLFNASEEPFEGWVLLSPWTEAPWAPHWRIVDSAGAPRAFQAVAQEALVRFAKRILVRTRLGPGERECLFIDHDGGPGAAAPGSNAAFVRGCALHAGEASVDLSQGPRITLSGLSFSPMFVLRSDLSDTWSHGVTQFDGERLAEAAWEAPEVADEGPLMVAAVQRGRIGEARLVADWRAFEGGVVELTLDIDWRAERQILKLELPMPYPLEGRTDGVLGGAIDRGLEARERPLQDFTLIRLASGDSVGVACPDVFGIDARGDTVGLTLLRSPFMAHHDPVDPADFVRRTTADQGPHRFRFQFFAGRLLDPQDLARRALMIQRPPLVVETTQGMTARSA
jgi:alpha-mannosidase